MAQMPAANKTLSDSELLQNIAQSLQAHNQFLASAKGKIYIAREWIRFYEQHYHESLLENRRKEKERRAKLTKKLHGKNKVMTVKKYLELRPRREIVGNPIYAWFAFLQSQGAGLDIPDWVIGYLKQVATAIFFLPPRNNNSNSKKHLIKNPDSTIAEIFGFKGPGKTGRGNIISRHFDTAEVQLAAQVYLRLQTPGAQVKYVYEDVAKDSNKSEATVRRAWKKYRDRPDYFAPASKSP